MCALLTVLRVRDPLLALDPPRAENTLVRYLDAGEMCGEDDISIDTPCSEQRLPGAVHCGAVMCSRGCTLWTSVL